MRKERSIKHAYVTLLFAMLMVFAALLMPRSAFADDNGIPEGYEPTNYNGIPHVQMKDVFCTDTIEISGIKVTVKGGAYFNGPDDMIHFRIFNSTTQEDECKVKTVKDEDGNDVLPVMHLKKDHDYIFFVEDKFYKGETRYVQIRQGDSITAKEGPGAYDYMTQSAVYNKLIEIEVERRDSVCQDPYDENRFDTSALKGDNAIYVKYNGTPMEGIRLSFVSDLETLHVTTGEDGKLNLRLLEGVTYMVYVEGDEYVIDSFPIVAKNKNDYREGFLCNNHTNCVKVVSINLYDKGETRFDGRERVTDVTSLKKRTKVSGINFKNLIILDRYLDDEVSELGGKDYDAVDITAVNPRRWEISKLKGTDFTVDHYLKAGREVSNVYRIEDGRLQHLPFKQFVSGGKNTVRFTTDSLSLYKYVIEYRAADLGERASVKAANAVYTGKPLKPAVSVSVWGRSLKKGADYTLSYSKNTNVGKASVKVSGAGDYCGYKIVSFIINPKGTKLKKLTAGKRTMTVTWIKQTKQSDGYRIQYSTDKNFKKNNKTLTVKGSSKTKATVKKLKSGKNYYVRIGTYKKTGGKTYYSAWSKSLYVKVR